MNRVNLEKLAAYLEQLPEGYDHFDMCDFYQKYFIGLGGIRIGRTKSNPETAIAPSECGAVACAIGHAPAAGIPALPGEYWAPYAVRVFELLHNEWVWCFDGEWECIDNTPQGAAKRIRYLLAFGPPSDWKEQLDGEADYLFAHL